ncbi:MAG: DUF4238 domain-containing protein [Gammaproteobacteria bacterium]
MKKFARNHHVVPQGYLAGFTEDRTRDGRLFVSDLISRSVFQTKPRNVGAERDFNRIDVDGQDPDALERALGKFEGRAISVIRGIQTSGGLPADEEFSYVLNLMALLIVRNPRSRKNMNNARHHTVRVIGDLLASDKRLFEHHIAKAKEDGFVPQDAEVSFEAMRQFIHDDQYTVTVSTSESLSLELAGFDNTLQLLGSRYWSLVTAAVDAPDFVTCDHPVTPVFKDLNRRGPIGYGLPETEVSFPLNTRQALLGVLQDPLAVSIEARASQVAALNSRTVYHAARQVYSKTASVAVLRSGGISTLH